MASHPMTVLNTPASGLYASWEAIRTKKLMTIRGYLLLDGKECSYG